MIWKHPYTSQGFVHQLDSIKWFLLGVTKPLGQESKNSFYKLLSGFFVKSVRQLDVLKWFSWEKSTKCFFEKYPKTHFINSPHGFAKKKKYCQRRINNPPTIRAPPRGYSKGSSPTTGNHPSPRKSHAARSFLIIPHCQAAYSTENLSSTSPIQNHSWHLGKV